MLEQRLFRRPPGRVRSIALALALAAIAAAAPARTPGEVEVGQVLRDATLQGLNGPARKLSEFRGKPLVINVWASWCGPCRAEMASLERLAWSAAGRHFAIIGISTDDYQEAARDWLKQSNATLSHFIDRKLEMENMLGASQVPLTVLVDANGRIIQKVYGAKEWDGAKARRLIDQAFRGKPAPAAR
jgi:thiol-disulfide isomerase/thioredoxin